MEYLCFTFKVEPADPGSEILAAALSEGNFESFEFSRSGFNAYVKKNEFNDEIIENLKEQFPDIGFSYSLEEIKKQNWNKEWEKNFTPVLIENLCCIRASFHTAPAPPLLDIIIEPKMSFGTGHHQTTWLMSKALFSLDLKGKSVLDVGCGTGILAIISKKLDSQTVTGIDIDEWSIENSRENRKANGFSRETIDFYQGNIGGIENETYDVILANINKNILQKEMIKYAAHLNKGGKLLLSGFFETDCKELISAAENAGLKNIGKETKNEWAILIFEK
ncbi:MAG TPA: 50S ribosomal protein L11 methyltransferase [Bacteroidia bacterium]|jgi:ribosomal protein L11 methyltransferase|nr:50S ribosomal protein L11 methyltransferase [Bacteroidia bacterium]